MPKIPATPLKKRGNNCHQSTTIVSLFAKQLESAKSTPKVLVECPVCKVKIPESSINRHLDNECLKTVLATTNSMPNRDFLQNDQICDCPTTITKYSLDSSDEIKVRKKFKGNPKNCNRTPSTDCENECIKSKSIRRNLNQSFNECAKTVDKVINPPRKKLSLSKNAGRKSVSQNIQTEEVLKGGQYNVCTEEDKTWDSETSFLGLHKSNVVVSPVLCLEKSHNSQQEASMNVPNIQDFPPGLEQMSKKSDKSLKENLQPEKRFADDHVKLRNIQDPVTNVSSPRGKEFLQFIPERFSHIKLLLSPEKKCPLNERSAPESPLNRGHLNVENEQMKYYLKNFLSVLRSVLDDDDFSLLDSYDLSVLQKFYLLSGKAQKLYVRLFTRKFFWISVLKMKYPEIDDDLEPVLQELRYNDFVQFEDSISSLSTIIKLIPIAHLKQLCKKLNIPNSVNKSTMQNHIIQLSKQRSVLPEQRVDEAIEKEARKGLGRCCLLSEVPRKVFIRILMLYLLTETTDDSKHEDRPIQLESLLKVDFGLVVFPPYEIKRCVRIFRSRDDLIRYEMACSLKMEIESEIESKEFHKALNISSLAVGEFEKLLKDNDSSLHVSNLPVFLRKYTAGDVYARCLDKRVELLQRLKLYEEAVAQLKSLLEQRFYYQRSRGQWLERLALNFDRHLKRPLNALEVICDAFCDDGITIDHKLGLRERAQRIFASRQTKKLARPYVQNLPKLTIRKAKEIFIKGEKFDKSIPGYKTVFIAPQFSESGNNVHDVIFCSVEEFAILHYQSCGFSSGLHGEGSSVISFFGLLFWDIIYQSGIPDAFRSLHQRCPLDLGSSEFYTRRKSEIDQRLEMIRSSPIENLVEIMGDVWTNHEGQSSLVRWNLFRSFERLESLAMCIGSKYLALLCQRFAMNCRQYCSGFPDIIVWNAFTGEWKVVEVKGPGDKLSHKQLLWLDYLLENEVNVEVCHVKATGGKIKQQDELNG